ncbi:hypothetical protein BpHYR1_042655 [Brachionus plicatilis]|uniref:Uncharacterized protein n=1 Tax=Brachionus plicatilis TaxID=10195 RepID=A0A3M7Q927_BRAPC|nr:hypothetical protein BpHYR1_042655 [Brachionus plicatilis]
MNRITVDLDMVYKVMVMNWRLQLDRPMSAAEAIAVGMMRVVYKNQLSVILCWYSDLAGRFLMKGYWYVTNKYRLDKRTDLSSLDDLVTGRSGFSARSSESETDAIDDNFKLFKFQLKKKRNHETKKLNLIYMVIELDLKFFFLKKVKKVQQNLNEELTKSFQNCADSFLFGIVSNFPPPTSIELIAL